MVNYYRAIARRSEATLNRRIEIPTLIIWGTSDPFLDERLAQASSSMCSSCRVLRLPQVMHNPQREAASAVNMQLVSFLTEIGKAGDSITASGGHSPVDANTTAQKQSSQS
jgi:pimeloyl-ACP methyl ester carboxylesterase